MAYKFIVCDPNLCDGCQICELACSTVKEGAHNLLLSRIRNVRVEPLVMMSTACRLCSKPACVTACPRDALSQDEQLGIIHVDEKLCDGCTWCIEACKFGAIALNHGTRTVVICDLCKDLLQPRCVEFCPKEALSLSRPEVIGQRLRSDVLGRLIGELALAAG